MRKVIFPALPMMRLTAIIAQRGTRKSDCVALTNSARDRERFIIRADEMLTAFTELEGAIHEFAVSLIS
jgi:hypothetical protein